MDQETIVRKRQGVLCALGAHGLWGVIPVYFKWLKPLTADQILAHRIIWSLVFLAVIISVGGRWGDVRRALSDSATRLLLTASSILIGLNWLAFLYLVEKDHVLETSLGYFIMPLTNVLLGVLILGERLRPVQVLSVGFAFAGVACITLLHGDFPWLAMSLAVTFALYGLLRKQVSADAVVGLTVETLILAPLAVVALQYFHGASASTVETYSQHGLLLGVSGIVTTLPLLLFTGAARRLRLSTLGLLQYITPTISFLLAVFWYGEPFEMAHAVAFAFIWTGVLVYCVDSLLHSTRETPPFS